MKLFSIFLNFVSWIFIGAVVILLFYTLSSNTTLFANYKSYLVLSGSMEPTIMTGDIIIIHKKPSYYKNDVVTFNTKDGRIVTHRIIKEKTEKKRRIFMTKGDANRSEDEALIDPTQIIGKVTFIVPKLGYFVAFSKSLPGLITLVFIPAGLILIGELVKIINKS